MFGFLNIYKPVGMTSHDVVSVLRKIFKIKQIGHTGTLDPFAEGVLPISVGKATKLIELLEDDKAYIGRFCFGKNTTTYDIEGEVTKEFDKKISFNELKTCLKDFEGEIEQIPPIYSAIKIDGKKLYEYAREGKKVEINPRKIFIEKIEIKDFKEEEQFADIYIKCSKGTYIRSIAYDIGMKLNCGAYLSKLCRVKAGRFEIKNSIKLDEIKEEMIEDILINPIDYLSQKKQVLNETEYKRISHGMNIYNRINAKSEIVLLEYENKLIGIAEANENGLQPKKVFI